MKKFNAVMIVPTGIGCEIGGHAGDATPAARLLASCCDKLIVHPNVVNASDINEMTDNMLYVEGSILDRFLEDKIGLEEVRQNKILLVTNTSIHNETINAASAARATLGADIRIVKLKVSLVMKAKYNQDGTAGGTVEGWEELVNQVQTNEQFDALAIASVIQVDGETEYKYWREGGVNPWGKIESITSKLIADKINKPVAHSPVIEKEAAHVDLIESDIVVDPRMSAEIVSWAMLHCILKGLHQAPRVTNIAYKDALTVKDIDVMITPKDCWGSPHRACEQQGIPIIQVKENKTVYSNNIPKEWLLTHTNEVIVVNNYWEAAGILQCMQAGVLPESVRRPIKFTEIINA